MGKAKEQLGCRALALAEPASLPSTPIDLSQVVDRLLVSRSPLGVRLHKRSDLALVDAALRELSDMGFLDEEAHALLACVLCSPDLALRSLDGARVLQASSAHTSHGPVRVVATASVVRANPPILSDLDVVVDPIDPELDRADLVLEVAEWSLQFPSPDKAPPELDERWVFIGDPSRLGILEIPGTWQRRIKALANVLGTDVVISKDGATAIAMSLEGLENKFALSGSISERDGHRIGKYRILGGSGVRFAELERLVATDLIRLVATRAAGRREELRSGARVFHRKVNSGGGRDYFGKPLAGACLHGVDGFIRFSSAPQAERGMAALYENFQPRMLYHCSQFPKCNVYAVFFD